MTRRAPGEGSIRQRADGRWEATLTVGYTPAADPARGPLRRERISFYGKTQRAVAEQLAAARRRLAQGQGAQSPRTTVGAFLTRWLDEVKTPGLEPSSRHRFEVVVRLHLVPAFGTVPLGRLAPEDVQRWVSAQAKVYAPRTVHLHHRVLFGALRTAVRWRLLATNPAADITLPRIPRAKRPVLDAGPARAVLHAARGTWHEALFVVALTTGCRIGELVPLRWDDWDESAHLLHIRRRLVDYGRTRHEGAPKTEAGLRDQPLPTVAEAALRRHRAAQAARRLELGTWEADGYLFTTRQGRRIRAGSITSWHLPRLLAAAELPRMRTHDLRHSFASLLRELGEPVEVVVQLLGHADPGMLMRVYRTLYERETRRAVDRLGALLEGDC